MASTKNVVSAQHYYFQPQQIQGGPKVDVLLIAFLYLWLEFWEGIDKYWIVPVRKLFCFHHWLQLRIKLVTNPVGHVCLFNWLRSYIFLVVASR